MRLLRAIDLYVRYCKRRKDGTCVEDDQEMKEEDDEKGKKKINDQEEEGSESGSFRWGMIRLRIQDLVSGITYDLHSAYSRSWLTPALYGHRIFVSAVTRSQKNVKLFLEKYINEWCIVLLDYSSLNFIVFLSENLKSLKNFFVRKYINGVTFSNLIETLIKQLMFFNSLIRFAGLQGVEDKQLRDLLFYVECVAVRAAALISKSLCDHDRYEIECELSQLLHQNIYGSPNVRETCIHVLNAAKLSRLSDTIDLETKMHLVVNFIDILLDNLMNLLESYTSFLVQVKDQMLKLHQGVRFLRILLRQQQEEFNKLGSEMKDLIGVVICDAGIVIFSLSVNEMKEGLAKETDRALVHLLEVLKLIIAEVALIYPPSSFTFPGTDQLGSYDFLLKSLEQLASCEDDSLPFPKAQIHTIQDDLISLRSLLGNIVDQSSQNEKLQALWDRAMEMAYKVELVIDSIVVEDNPKCLDIMAREIKLMKTEALEIFDSVRHDMESQRVTKNSIHMESQISTPTIDEVLVGLDGDVETIIDKLTWGSKRLEIVSVVGMAGLGKTTFANRVYKDPSILGHFHIRAWCTVSQAYTKHNLLGQLLRCIDCRSPDQYHKVNEDDLAEQLHKRLKGYKYVIVLDDLWHIDAWNLLKISFPDDDNGSRILLTSRCHDLSLQIKPDSMPYHLRSLTDQESWALLQSRIFGKKGCPPAVSEVGMQIAKYCKGLPLTVVIVAGILSSVEEDCWEEVARCLSSRTFIQTEQCMKTLELSYSQLPNYLKPCLLYMGAFPEDRDIHVQKLKLLWISEGFVLETEEKSLEDVADDYLMDLINRSLVKVSKQRSLDGVKTCQMHDILREFCLAKAREERFIQTLHGDSELFTCITSYNTDRVCLDFTTLTELKKLFLPHLRSLLYFGYSEYLNKNYFLCLRIFKLVRVLDLEDVHLGNFPREIVLLVHLRYLAIYCDTSSIPASIANLSGLDTFVIGVYDKNVGLPNTIWNMKKLRHLRVKGLDCGFSFPIDNLEVSPDLYHLDTLTLAIGSYPQSLQRILTKLPSIRRLRIVSNKSRKSIGSCNRIVDLDFLSRLESLTLCNFWVLEFGFPQNLKKLTLWNNDASYGQPWSESARIGMLPSLEVLKLRGGVFVGETWEMKQGEFPKLRFLELDELDIVRWTASCDDFPPLEKLVLHDCKNLEELPSSLGDIPTINLIEVGYCHKSAVSLIKQIQEQQVDMGNECLKVIIKVENWMYSWD